jgi:hypothetical protein
MVLKMSSYMEKAVWEHHCKNKPMNIEGHMLSRLKPEASWPFLKVITDVIGTYQSRNGDMLVGYLNSLKKEATWEVVFPVWLMQRLHSENQQEK